MSSIEVWFEIYFACFCLKPTCNLVRLLWFNSLAMLSGEHLVSTHHPIQETSGLWKPKKSLFLEPKNIPNKRENSVKWLFIKRSCKRDSKSSQQSRGKNPVLTDVGKISNTSAESSSKDRRCPCWTPSNVHIRTLISISNVRENYSAFMRL